MLWCFHFFIVVLASINATTITTCFIVIGPSTWLSPCHHHRHPFHSERAKYFAARWHSLPVLGQNCFFLTTHIHGSVLIDNQTNLSVIVHTPHPPTGYLEPTCVYRSCLMRHPA